MNKNRYEGLDNLRVVCSLSIVFVHVYSVSGYPSALNKLVNLRDFALPLMVMTSIFLLTKSLKNKKPDFIEFFKLKCKRLWLPLLIWTSIYSFIISFCFPNLLGIEVFGESISLQAFFTGYRHLWYLQFLFLTSLLCYPILKYWGKESDKQNKIILFGGVGISLFYGFAYQIFLKQYLYSNTSINLDIFVSQTGKYAVLIPIAMAFGLLNERISSLFRSVFARGASIILVFMLMWIITRNSEVLFAKEVYGIAVFLVALQPWRRINSSLWQKMVSHSYGVYIIHFFFVQMLWLYLESNETGLNDVSVIGWTLIIYLTSVCFSMMIRFLFPFDFALPLVAFKKDSMRNEIPTRIYPPKQDLVNLSTRSS